MHPLNPAPQLTWLRRPCGAPAQSPSLDPAPPSCAACGQAARRGLCILRAPGEVCEAPAGCTVLCVLDRSSSNVAIAQRGSRAATTQSAAPAAARKTEHQAAAIPVQFTQKAHPHCPQSCGPAGWGPAGKRGCASNGRPQRRRPWPPAACRASTGSGLHRVRYQGSTGVGGLQGGIKHRRVVLEQAEACMIALAGAMPKPILCSSKTTAT